MKIAYMIYDRPNYCAGPLVFARRLLPELKRRGHEITALVGYREGESPVTPILRESGINVRAVAWPLYTHDQVRWILEQLADVDFDVFSSNMSISGAYAGRWVRESGRATIVSHLGENEFNWGIVRRFVAMGDEWSASGVYCMSDDSRRKILDMKPTRTDVCVIPAGAPIAEKPVCQEGPIRLVYAGRITEDIKRISDVVVAMERTLLRYPTATAKIIGDGPAFESIKFYIDRSAAQKQFSLVGHVQPEEVQRQISDCNVLVLLSESEGMPGSVMDAMGAGLIPVCLDIEGGLPELVLNEQTGFLVKDRVESFDRAMDRLESDIPLRKRLAANARSHVVENFSLDASTQRFESFCDQLTRHSGTKKKLRTPTWLVLPPTIQGIDREDRRRETTRKLMFKKVRKLARRARRWLARAIRPSTSVQT